MPSLFQRGIIGRLIAHQHYHHHHYPKTYIILIILYHTYSDIFGGFPFSALGICRCYQKLYIIYSTEMSQDNIKTNKYKQTLANQYPHLEWHHLSKFIEDTHMMDQLASCIDYRIPKQHYPSKLVSFEAELFEHYLIQLQRQRCDGSFDNEQTEGVMMEDNHEHAMISVLPDSCINVGNNPNNKTALSILEVRQLLQEFDIEAYKNQVNSELFHGVKTFSKLETKLEYVQLPGIFGDNKFKKNNRNSESLQNGGKEEAWKKNKIQLNQSKNSSPLTPIELGSKVPIETKIMRNQVKKLASNSFSVLSQENQKMLSNFEHTKTSINLLVNKLSPDVLETIYEELGEMITEDEKVCEYLIKKVIETCTNSPAQNIKILMELSAKLCRIPNKQFAWSLDQQPSQKINYFHYILSEYLERQFSFELARANEKPRQFIALCMAIAHLINLKKFSKRIFLEVLESIFIRIMSNKSNGSEYHFEAIISMCTILQCKIFEIQKKLPFERKINKELRETILQLLEIQEFPESLIELMIQINNKFQTETQKINCLLLNLKDKITLGKKQIIKEKCHNKIKQVKAVKEQNLHRDHIKEVIIQELNNQTPYEQTLKQIYECNDQKHEILSILLKAVYDADKRHVQRNIGIFKSIVKPTDENVENFKLLWDKHISQFYIEECDYPFMIEVLAQAIRYLLPDCIQSCRIKLEEEHIDFEDCEYFMEKLFKKLQED